MRKIKLTKEERAIEDHIEEFVPIGQKEMTGIVQAIAARKKDAVLNIRISRNDLDGLKQRARKLGIKYQSFVSEILHRVAHT